MLPGSRPSLNFGPVIGLKIVITKIKDTFSSYWLRCEQFYSTDIVSSPHLSAFKSSWIQNSGINVCLVLLERILFDPTSP